jgi:hypothetical protein
MQTKRSSRLPQKPLPLKPLSSPRVDRERQGEDLRVALLQVAEDRRRVPQMSRLKLALLVIRDSLCLAGALLLGVRRPRSRARLVQQINRALLLISRL